MNVGPDNFRDDFMNNVEATPPAMIGGKVSLQNLLLDFVLKGIHAPIEEFKRQVERVEEAGKLCLAPPQSKTKQLHILLLL